jgi:hypothetical protein
MNGHWDVTETKGVSRGHSYGPGRGALKDCFSIPSIPKAILALRDKPDVHPESYEMQLYYTKLMKVMKEGIYIGAEYYNPMFCFG